MSSLTAVADGLDFPTSLAFDNDHGVYLAESGLPFAGAAPGGRIWRMDRDGAGRRLVADQLAAPVTGLLWHQDHLYVSEGGAGRITRIGPDGKRTVIVDGLPGPGNYHVDMAVAGPDGKLYFAQGAMSNLGIIGLDAYELGWLGRLPHAYDVPGLDIELTGVNATTRDPLSGTPGAQAVTGAFAPFGTATRPGQRVAAELPCTASVMRCDLDGGNLELVAWGIRNAFGLGFLPDGRLLAVDQGADDRGSRPIGNAPDLLLEIHEGAWYGWPDFIGGIPVTDPRFAPERGPQPTFLLAGHDRLPPPEQAVLDFEAHVAATKFAVAPPGSAFAGQLVVTLFGDEAPMTLPPGGPQLGRHLLMVDPDDWSTRGLPGEPELHRPIDVGFAPGDPALYVLDFGRFEMTDHGVEAKAGSGRLLRWEGWDRPAASTD
ncbi:PQQ-dependent sugar dehydrogenase [Streptomyces sp. NPDC050842]|uniref:PQQ-dependent sugar dehydrogenase n=1 Tax=Streptomyces sp. NPDC050842 TaxID=3365636 RepID=UPI0037B20F6D